MAGPGASRGITICVGLKLLSQDAAVFRDHSVRQRNSFPSSLGRHSLARRRNQINLTAFCTREGIATNFCYKWLMDFHGSWEGPAQGRRPQGGQSTVTTPGAKRVRSFIAIPVPRVGIQVLEDAVKSLDSDIGKYVRWVRPEGRAKALGRHRQAQ